jgi:hypothetical protein
LQFKIAKRLPKKILIQMRQNILIFSQTGAKLQLIIAWILPIMAT